MRNYADVVVLNNFSSWFKKIKSFSSFSRREKVICFSADETMLEMCASPACSGFSYLLREKTKGTEYLWET